MQLLALYWFLSILYYYIYISFLSTFFTTSSLFVFVEELKRAGIENGIHVSATTSSVMKLLALNRLISYCACACPKCGVSLCRRLCCVWSVDTSFYNGSVKFRLRYCLDYQNSFRREQKRYLGGYNHFISNLYYIKHSAMGALKCSQATDKTLGTLNTPHAHICSLVTSCSSRRVWIVSTWNLEIDSVQKLYWEADSRSAFQDRSHMLLTLRLLMSYIYIYIYIYIYGAPILGVSRSHTTTHHSR